jgi:hypothetical protein
MTSSNVKPVRRSLRQAYLRSVAASGAASANRATTNSEASPDKAFTQSLDEGCVIGMLTSNGVPAAASFLVGTAPSKTLPHRQAILPPCA